MAGKREMEGGNRRWDDGGVSVWREFQGCINVRSRLTQWNGVQPQEVKLQETRAKSRAISAA